MIVVMKKNNILLIGLVLLLVIAIYSLNINEERVVSVTKEDGNQAGNSQKVVILDPGHGGEDPGAVSDYSGIREKDVNLEIAFKVKELLEAEGYRVIMTREEDKLQYNDEAKTLYQKRKQDLTRRKKIMDEAGADVVVSIHLNKFGQTQYYGAQTFYPPNSLKSQKLAVCIQKRLREMVDPSNNRQSLVKKEPIIILRDLKTTTAVVECGFLSNREEESRLATEEYRDKLAAAIKQGIMDYFKE